MADDATLYECMYILDIEQEEDEMRAAVDAVESVIDEENGEVKETLQYGRRPLAYNIGERTEGLYIITYFEGGGNVVRALNNEFRSLETIIRGIVVVANPKAIHRSERAKPSKEEAEAAAAEEAEVAEGVEAETADIAVTEAEEETEATEPAEVEETTEPEEQVADVEEPEHVQETAQEADEQQEPEQPDEVEAEQPAAEEQSEETGAAEDTGDEE